MTNKRYLIGIDNGSQSTKVTIFDSKGKEVAFGSWKLKDTLTPEPGVVIHPDDDLWTSVYNAMEICLKNFNGIKEEIEGIGLCTIRSCRVLLKKDGSLAQPVLNWMDDRLARPYVHEDDNVEYVTTTSGYIGFRLTGEFNDTAGNYEVNWPLDRTTWNWSKDESVLKANGLTREKLFNLVKPGEKIGTLKDFLSEQFGLKKGIPVVATSNDKAVEVLGSGIKDESSIMISLGTYISAMMLNNENFDSANNFFPTLASMPFMYAYESNGIRRGMWTVSWFKKLIGQELADNAEKLNIKPEDYLNKKAEDIPVGSEGLITILDWLASPAIPYRKGMMIGFDQRHSRYHIYRSILEAIAYNIKNNIDDMLVELNTEIKEIVVTGGGANSDVLMQIIADLFGLPTYRRKGNSIACIGAAISAGTYLEVFDDFSDGIDQMVKTEKVFFPIKDNHEFYNKVNETVVKNIRPYTDEILKRSYPIFK